MNILYIEDADFVREPVVSYLQSRGHNVMAEANGNRGLSLALKESLDLIMLDLRLEGMSGFVILEKVRAARINTQVVILTAVTSSNELNKLNEYENIKLCKKPIAIEELVSIVEAF